MVKLSDGAVLRRTVNQIKPRYSQNIPDCCDESSQYGDYYPPQVVTNPDEDKKEQSVIHENEDLNNNTVEGSQTDLNLENSEPPLEQENPNPPLNQENSNPILERENPDLILECEISCRDSKQENPESTLERGKPQSDPSPSNVIPENHQHPMEDGSPPVEMIENEPEADGNNAKDDEKIRAKRRRSRKDQTPRAVRVNRERKSKSRAREFIQSVTRSRKRGKE